MESRDHDRLYRVLADRLDQAIALGIGLQFVARKFLRPIRLGVSL
jgi:hypothetical protein